MTNQLFDGLFGHYNPDALLAILPDGRRYTYQGAVETSARFANLLTDYGIQKGDRVAVQVPKSIEAALLYIGCIRAGAIFLPLNTAYTASEISYFLEDAAPALFVCDPDRADEMKAITDSLNIRLETMGVLQADTPEAGSLIHNAKSTPTEFKNMDCAGDDLAAILYTSGTTGRSKGAMLSHANLLSNSQTLKDLWQFTSDDVLLHALPIFHTHGLFVAINVVLASGASMIFLSGFKQDEIINHLHSSTSMMGVPTFYTRLLGDERFTRELVSHMRLFISGSAPLLAETHIQFEELTGQKILERYGMTETNMNTSNPYDGERRAGTVGFPLPGVSVKICHPETGDELADGEIGILEVKGPNVFSGYWNMPEKTAEELRENGFFITGDLAKKDEDGYIQIVGRSKDLIISGGYNIYPKEVELALDEEENIVESAVIGVPHSDFGEAVVAVVVCNDKGFDPTIAMQNIKSKLARYKQPKEIIVVETLPRNTMGKVQKNILRDSYSHQFA